MLYGKVNYNETASSIGIQSPSASSLCYFVSAISVMVAVVCFSLSLYWVYTFCIDGDVRRWLFISIVMWNSSRHYVRFSHWNLEGIVLQLIVSKWSVNVILLVTVYSPVRLHWFYVLGLAGRHWFQLDNGMGLLLLYGSALVLQAVYCLNLELAAVYQISALQCLLYWSCTEALQVIKANNTPHTTFLNALL